MTTEIENFFNRHQKVALQFSGAGKDSLATLYLLEEYWGMMDVIWGNPGNPYPETRQFVNTIREMVPNFIEVIGNQPAYIQQHGYPSDIIPFEAMPQMSILTGEPAPKLVPFQVCCAENLWHPLWNYIIENKYTGVIRGQKQSDLSRNRITENGKIYDGVEMLFPIDSWTDEQVIAFLGDRLPESYKRGMNTSLDCLNCTAWLRENRGMMKDLREHYPDAYYEIKPIINWLDQKVKIYSELLGDANGD